MQKLRRPSWQVIVAGILAVLGCCVLAQLGRSGGSTAAAPTAAPAQAIAADLATDVPAAPAAPTDTPAPTETPAPTDTPEPTATPAPTDTPEPTATPIPPIDLSGSGQTATDPVIPPSSVSAVTFSHQGRRNFIVYAYKDDGSKDLLVNTIGGYEGTRPLFGYNSVFFDIDADGPWTAHIESVVRDDAAAGGVTGVGDVVSGFFMPDKKTAPFNLAHDGKRNFVVYLHCASGSDLVENTIGAVAGSTVITYGTGPCLWEVQADGAWVVTTR